MWIVHFECLICWKKILKYQNIQQLFGHKIQNILKSYRHELLILKT